MTYASAGTAFSTKFSKVVGTSVFSFCIGSYDFLSSCWKVDLMFYRHCVVRLHIDSEYHGGLWSNAYGLGVLGWMILVHSQDCSGICYNTLMVRG